ncbi:N-acetyltransferase [Neokomagataea tanensis]|uniref:N-acetyltransferase n=2 Tax=Acetobacteraceae TaxID=433 RepID=A0A4Y6V7F8_9PROT|nr:N-acetyltransferase [Neokomagataea tanensis]
MLTIRPARSFDRDEIWRCLAPVMRSGETYALPRHWSQRQVLSYWMQPLHRVYVALTADQQIVGTFYIRDNQQGGGSHTANAGFVASPGFGAGRAMAEFALQEAERLGYRAMQFNFVVSTNERAIALWHALGFSTLARVPEAFDHPKLGMVDALIMWRRLSSQPRVP